MTTEPGSSSFSVEDSPQKSAVMEWDELEEYPYTIIKNMMFAYGDSDLPLEVCQQFLADLGKFTILVFKNRFF